MLYLKNTYRILKHALVVPIIFSLVIPLVITDIWVEIYHRTCFPLCKIPYVKRKNYIKIDRHKLKYLTLLQKVYCMYCGYANGLVNYLVQIGARTEKYWCGIKHKESKNFIPPKHHEKFSNYDDEKDFKQKYKS